MSGTTISSTASGSGHKVPRFSVKAGFVIPKNKLSGSLVPVLRGGNKLGASGVLNDESTKQAPRKTKWGLDLTQDASVKRGKALAYQVPLSDITACVVAQFFQTRVDQITQQLKYGISVVGDGGDLALGSQSPDHHHDSSGHRINSEKAEELELEKREAIGEILKLNPSYKVPSDYKPLLKEGRVSIPVKQYPGYNFVGLVFGPGGDNQKRLEKETGATIQVYGTKIEGGQKVELKPSDGNESHSSYEDLYVHISADTFEKVDAAVSVIEMLITSVSGNLAATSATSSGKVVQVPLNQDVAPSDLGHSPAMQPVSGPTLTPPQGQFLYPGQWYPVVPPNATLHQPSGFIPPPNSSAPPFNNHAHMSTTTFRPSNMPSLFSPPPLPVVGFNSLPQNPSLVTPRPQPPAQVLQHPYMAHTSRHPSPTAPQLPLVQADDVSASLPSTEIQQLPMGIIGPSMPSLPQPVSSHPPGSLPVDSPASAGFSSMSQMAPRMVPTNALYPIVPERSIVSTALPSNMSTAISVSPMNPTSASPGFPSLPQPQRGLPPSLSASISPTPVPAHAFGSAPTPSPGILSSVYGGVENFAPVKPPLLTGPRSGNLGFQPDRPQNPASQTAPWTSNQFGIRNVLPTNSLLQPPASQPLPVFPRPPVGNNVGQPQPQHQHQHHMSVVPFAGNQTGILGPGLPIFPDASNVMPRNQTLQVGPRNLSTTPQMPVLPGALPARPGNHFQLQNYPVQMVRPENLLAQNHQLNNNLSFASGRSASTPGGQQLYDPFSPTSMSIAPRQQQGGMPRR